MTPALRLRFGAVSDVGRVRKDNQDSGYAGPWLLAVADGVGGAARGDIASHTAIAQVRQLDSPPPADPDQLLESVAGSIQRVHERIADLVDAHPELDSTSTTLTVGRFDGHRLALGHAGDSRAYLLRDGQLRQLTTDHTFVQSLIDEGRITEDEARVHPHRHLILRAVDGAHETDPDLFLVELRAGDRLMFCSDGASGALDDDRLAALLADGTPDSLALDIVRTSIEAGSSDNVTVVVGDVVPADEVEEVDATQPGGPDPLVVGAATTQPRKLLSGLSSGRSRLRAVARRADTGELDPVPAEAAGAIATDPEDARYAPRDPGRFRWIRRVLSLAVVLVLIWLAGTAAYGWTQRQYFIAASNGHVAIFKGVQADVPLVKLNHVYQEYPDLAVSSLPTFYQGQVTSGMDADSLTGARSTVQRLRIAATCAHRPPASTPSTKPRKKPTAGATPTLHPRRGTTAGHRRPTATHTARPTARPTATAPATPDPCAGQS